MTDYHYICDMKHFKPISTMFITAIAIIFCCNLFYLARLYGSIRKTVERDVMSAIADADIDELWIRANGADLETSAEIDSEQADRQRNHGELSAGVDSTGSLKAESVVNGETVSTQTLKPDKDCSFNNLFSQTISRQFHIIIDPHLPVNLNVLDSVISVRLNNRFIYPEFVSAEIVDSLGQTISGGKKMAPGNADVFTYCFNPSEGLSYRVCITPLTRHIFSEMAGVVTTVFLLLISFSSAFLYLFRTVSRLRSIEEMKDDFVSNMTHELKTPIAIAYSANDALLNYDAESDAGKRETYLKIANKQLKRLGELVENILAISMERRNTMKLKPEKIHLSPFVEEIAATQRMRGDKDITISVDVDGGLYVYADKSHLTNVMNNLIDNAIKYSGETVAISVSADRAGISVADNGIGIPAKALPYLFNKFYRVPHGNRQDVRGYGIGLYYVKSILDKMGWSIDVRSTEGEGSVFTIKFSKDEQ